MNNLKGILLFVLSVSLVWVGGCKGTAEVNRENFGSLLSRACRTNYQARVAVKEAGDTVWIYLPYTPGRSGNAATKEEGNGLYLEYEIASINPYKTIDPPELKFLVQKILGEIRQLLLLSARPYKFFVLVITNIADPKNRVDQWYIGYIDDVKNHSAGKDFSGEGYSRLVWHQEKFAQGEEENAASYRDLSGTHLRCYDMTMKEFVDKQIKWRIYKRFTVEYNKTPFDVTAQEKQDEIWGIIKAVLTAYNFKEVETYYLKDSSFLGEAKSFTGLSRDDILKGRSGGITRKPAF